MDKQKQDNQLEPAYSSFVPIRDVALKTCRKQWTIGRGGEKGISVLMARHDDDEHITEKKESKFTNTCTYILVNVDVYNLSILTVYRGLFICECALHYKIK